MNVDCKIQKNIYALYNLYSFFRLINKRALYKRQIRTGIMSISTIDFSRGKVCQAARVISKKESIKVMRTRSLERKRERERGGERKRTLRIKVKTSLISDELI